MDLIPGLIGGLILVLACRRARLGPEVALVGGALVAWLFSGRVPGAGHADLADAQALIPVLLLPALFRLGTFLTPRPRSRPAAPIAGTPRVLAKVAVRVLFCAAAMYLWILPSAPGASGPTLPTALLLGAALGMVGPLFLSSGTRRSASNRPVEQGATRELLVGLLVLQIVPHITAPRWQSVPDGLGIAAVSLITGVALGFLGGTLHRHTRDGLSRCVVDLATALAAFQISSLCGHALGSYSPDLATVLVAGATRSMTSANERAGRPESLREEGFWNTTMLVTVFMVVVVAGTRYADLFRFSDLGLVFAVWAGVVLLQGLLTFALEYGVSPIEGTPAWRAALYASWAGQPGVFVLGGALVFGLVDDGGSEAAMAHSVLAVRVIAQVVLLSLVVRGISRSWMMGFCFPEGPESVRSSWDLLEAKRVALRAGLERLLDLREEARVSEVPFETMRRGLTRELNELDAERTALRTEHPEIERHAWNQVLQDVLDEARQALEAARDRGDVSAAAAREFETVLSQRWLDATRSSVEEAVSARTKPRD